MSRRTKEEAQATRSAILDAAEHVFLRRGVASASLYDVAQQAGVSRGAVYWHFRDKADLFGAMMDRACLPIEETTVDPATVAPDGAVQALREHVRSVFRLAAHDERARRVFEIATHKVEYVDELVAVRERHLLSRARHMAHLEALVRAAQRAGHVTRRLPARTIALGLHALVDGLLQNWLLDPPAFDLVRTGLRTLDVHLAGLRGDPGPASPS